MLTRWGIPQGKWILLLAFLVFSPVLSAEFVWDDLKRETAGPAGDLSLTEAFRLEGRKIAWMYRPVTAVVMGAADLLGSTTAPARSSPVDPRRAWAPHLFSLALHLAATGLVMRLAARCLRGRPGEEAGVFAAGLSFALHPAHVENVAWVSAIADALATVFALGAFLAFFEWKDSARRKPLAFSALLFTLAALSKEIVLPLLLVVPAWDFFFPGGAAHAARRRDAAWVFAVLLLAVGYFLYVMKVSGMPPGEFLPPDLWLAGKQSLAALGFYVRKIFFPWPLTPLVPVLPGLAATLGWLAAALALAGGALYAAARGNRLPLFCLALFFLPLAFSVYIALRNLQSLHLAERFLYLPGVGFSLALGMVCAWLWSRGARRAVAASLVVLGAVYGTTAWLGAWTWHTQRDLMTAFTTQEQSKDQMTGWINLGIVELEAKEYRKAENLLRRALDPDRKGSESQRATSHALLGYALYRRVAAGAVESQAEAAFLRQEAKEELEAAVGMGFEDPRFMSILAELGSRPR